MAALQATFTPLQASGPQTSSRSQLSVSSPAGQIRPPSPVPAVVRILRPSSPPGRPISPQPGSPVSRSSFRVAQSNETATPLRVAESPPQRRAPSPSPEIGKQFVREASPPRSSSPPAVLTNLSVQHRASSPPGGPPTVVQSSLMAPRGSSPPTLRTVRFTSSSSTANLQPNLQLVATGASPTASPVFTSRLVRQESPSLAERATASNSVHSQQPAPMLERSRSEAQGLRLDHCQLAGVNLSMSSSSLPGLATSSSSASIPVSLLGKALTSRSTMNPWSDPALRPNFAVGSVGPPRRIISPPAQPSPRATPLHTPQGTPNQKDSFRSSLVMAGAPSAVIASSCQARSLPSKHWQVDAEVDGISGPILPSRSRGKDRSPNEGRRQTPSPVRISRGRQQRAPAPPQKSQADHAEEPVEARGRVLQEGQKSGTKQGWNSPIRTSELEYAGASEAQADVVADALAPSMGSMPSEVTTEELTRRTAELDPPAHQAIQDQQPAASMASEGSAQPSPHQLSPGRHPQLPEEVFNLFDDHIKAIRASLDSLGAQRSIAENLAQRLAQPGLRSTYGLPPGAMSTLPTPQVHTHVAAQQAKLTGELVAVLEELETQANAELAAFEVPALMFELEYQANGGGQLQKAAEGLPLMGLPTPERKDTAKQVMPQAGGNRNPPEAKAKIRKGSRGSGGDVAAAKAALKLDSTARKAPSKIDGVKKLGASQSAVDISRPKSPGAVKAKRAHAEVPPQASRARPKAQSDGGLPPRSSGANSSPSSPPQKERTRRLPSDSAGQVESTKVPEKAKARPGDLGYLSGSTGWSYLAPAAGPPRDPACSDPSASPKSRSRPRQSPKAAQLSSVARNAMSGTVSPPRPGAVPKRKMKRKSDVEAERLPSPLADAALQAEAVVNAEAPLDVETTSHTEAAFQAVKVITPSADGSKGPMATVGVDTNHDGRANMMVSGIDLNRDGIPDVLQAPMAKVGVDTNHDGRPNHFVVGPDRNRDGIPDVLQGLATVGVDTNHDGRANMFVTGVDRNCDGIPDVLQQAGTIVRPAAGPIHYDLAPIVTHINATPLDVISPVNSPHSSYPPLQPVQAVETVSSTPLPGELRRPGFAYGPPAFTSPAAERLPSELAEAALQAEAVVNAEVPLDAEAAPHAEVAFRAVKVIAPPDGSKSTAEELREFASLVLTKFPNIDAAWSAFDVNRSDRIAAWEFQAGAESIDYAGDMMSIFYALDTAANGWLSRREFSVLQHWIPAAAKKAEVEAGSPKSFEDLLSSPAQDSEVIEHQLPRNLADTAWEFRPEQNGRDSPMRSDDGEGQSLVGLMTRHRFQIQSPSQ